MKIQTLHIYNIASIVDETIHFDQAPLSNSDVFLITGDTGAGKTTILDSICLALFNDTPRLHNGKTVKVTTNKDNITLKDPRRLMRSNTGESLVELYFETGGKEYKAEWQVQRGREKKPTTSLGNVNRTFTNITTNHTITSSGTKDQELQEEIQNVIGLDFKQFCRTTMLAQNEFTKFLASDGNDRAAILEKITKTEEFSAVGAKIYEITSVKEKAWQTAQEQASDTGLKDENIAELQQTVKTLATQTQQKKGERDDADKKRNWLKRESELAESELHAKVAYDDASKLIEGPEYKKDCLFVNQWNATIEVRQWLRKKIEAGKTLADINKRRDILLNTFRKVLNGQEFNRRELENLTAELTQINQYLEQNAAKASTFDNAQTIIGYLDTIIEKSKKSSVLSASIAKETKERNEHFVPQMEEAYKRFCAEEKTRDGLSKQIKQKEEELSSFNLSDIRAERDAVKDLLRYIDVADADVKAIKSAEEAHEQEKQRLVDAKLSIEVREKELRENILPRYQTARANANAAEQARDLLKNSVDKFAKQMRTHLTIGCECPVCRQKIVSMPLEQEIDQIYSDANEQFERQQMELKKAESACNTAEAGIKADKKRYDADKAKFDADKSIENARAKAAASCLKCQIMSLTDDTQCVLDKLRQEKQAYLIEQIEKKINVGESKEKELKALRKMQTDQTTTYEDHRATYEKAKQMVLNSGTREANQKASLAEYQAEVQSSNDSARSLIADAQWLNDWTIDPVSFKAELKQASQDFNAKNKRKDQIVVTLGPKQNDYDQVSTFIARIREFLKEFQDIK